MTTTDGAPTPADEQFAGDDALSDEFDDPVGEVPPDDVTSDVGLRPHPPHSDGSVPPAVQAIAAWSWRFIVILAASALLLYIIVALKTVAVPVMVASLLAALLIPIVRVLTVRLRFPRALGAILTLLCAVGLGGGLVVMAGASIATGMGQLADRVMDAVNQVVLWLSDGPLQLDQDQINGYVDQATGQLKSNAGQIVSGALSVTSSVGHVLAGSLIGLFCLFFFLKDGRTIWGWIVGLFPAAARERVDGAGLRAWGSVASYARTQVVVAFVDALGIGIGAAILSVPLALPLGVLVFLGSFIPIVGAILTGAVAIVVALVDQGVGTALIMLLIVLGVQQAESNLLHPMLMSKALKLHPVGVLLAVSTGTLVGGIIGALFAVPVIAVLNTVLKYLHGQDPVPPSRREDLAELTRRWRLPRARSKPESGP